MSSGARAPGSVAWVELRTDDVATARDFYSAVLGWTFGGLPAVNGSDEVAQVNGSWVGGLAAGTPPGGGAQWSVFVEVEDLDPVVERVVAEGGSVASAITSTGVGRRVEIVDPAGAVLGLLEAATSDEGLLWGADGAVCWAECLSRDVEAVRPFYPAVFGWEAEPAVDGYTLFVLEGRHVGGLMAMPPMVPPAAPSLWTVYFSVSDLDGACNAVTRAGGTVVAPSHTIDEGRFAVIEDPAGAVCSLFEGRIG